MRTRLIRVSPDTRRLFPPVVGRVRGKVYQATADRQRPRPWAEMDRPPGRSQLL